MDSFVVFMHVIAGTIIVSMSSIMQLIVGPAVSLLPEGLDKKRLTEKLAKRRIPIMDSAIMIQMTSAIYLLYSRWVMISLEPVMIAKACCGFIGLSLAFSAHFYFRGKKKKLQAEGRLSELKTLNEKTRFIEPLVLVLASCAYFLGVFFNHM